MVGYCSEAFLEIFGVGEFIPNVIREKRADIKS